MSTSNHRVSVWAAGTHSIPPVVKVRDLPDLPSLPDSFPDLPEKPGKVEVADAGAKLLKRSGDEAPRTQQKRPRGIGLQPLALKPVGFLQLEDPWHSRLEKLDKLAVMDQAGSVVVAASRTKQKTKLVAVRELNGYSKSDLEHLRRAMDQHIVELIAVFFHHDVISLLYEVMELSVSDIVLTPKGILPLQERATICHAVLCGLRHIHALEAAHGDVTARTILLNRVGQVKIGAFGERMLIWKTSFGRTAEAVKQAKQADVDAVATVLVQMSEPDTHLANPTARNLARPKEAFHSLIGVLEAMPSSTCAELLEHSFMKEKRDPSYLLPYTFFAGKFRDQGGAILD